MLGRPVSPSDYLTGTEYASVDDKNRLFMSQEKRSVFRDGCWFAYDSIGCLVLFPSYVGAELIESLGGGGFKVELFLEADFKHLMREIVGTMEPAKFDASGRVVVPKVLKDDAGITKEANEVRIIGMGYWAEIWEKGRHASYRKEALAAHNNSLFDLLKNAILARDKALDRAAVLPKPSEGMA